MASTQTILTLEELFDFWRRLVYCVERDAVSADLEHFSTEFLCYNVEQRLPAAAGKYPLLTPLLNSLLEGRSGDLNKDLLLLSKRVKEDPRFEGLSCLILPNDFLTQYRELAVQSGAADLSKELTRQIIEFRFRAACNQGIQDILKEMRESFLEGEASVSDLNQQGINARLELFKKIAASFGNHPLLEESAKAIDIAVLLRDAYAKELHGRPGVNYSAREAVKKEYEDKFALLVGLDGAIPYGLAKEKIEHYFERQPSEPLPLYPYQLEELAGPTDDLFAAETSL